MGKKSKKGASKATAQASSKDDHEFEVDDRVTLKGLQSAQYNDKHGTIVSLPTTPKNPERRYGVLVDGSGGPIAIKPGNLEFADISNPSVRNGMTTSQQLKEREKMEEISTLTNAEAMSADQLMMMRMMRTMFLTEANQVKAFGRKIQPTPNFWQELKDAPGGGYPSGVNKKWADEYLRMAFEQADNLPHMMEFHITMEDYRASPKDVYKRIAIPDRRKLEWFFNQPRRPGDIFPRTMSLYSPFMRQSFSNQAYRRDVMHLGTTHVAIGFVDLGMLFAATLEDPPSTSCQGPLHFLGIDMSPYAVAKTLVIWELLKQMPAEDCHQHCRSISQVWFSTTWAEGTEGLVRRAIAELLRKPCTQYPYDEKVVGILQHWNDAPRMPLAEVRKKRSSFVSCARSSVGYLKRKVDRIALAKYELTGDFSVGKQPVCGNMIMFDCPEGTAPLASDESVFSALDWKEIADLLGTRKDVLLAAEELTTSQIKKVGEWARRELVAVSLVCAKVEDVVEFIAAATPWTMSWSNVCDYMDSSDFHRLARRCSVHGDTIHYGYSMNWVTNVFGVNIIDYQGKERTESRKEIVDASNQAVERAYKFFGWSNYLRVPPPCNPFNTTAHFCLEYMYFEGWAKNFFDIGRRGGPCNEAFVEHKIASPLSHTGASTVAFTWTYDPAVKFNPMEQTVPSTGGLR